MKNTIKIVLVIIGTLIGAGFASGKEIYIFFAQYNIYGIIGIVVSAIITAQITKKALKIVKKSNINNYKELLQEINPKSKNTNKIINHIVNAFLLTSFLIMVAGFSAYIKQTFSINTYISSTIFVAICYIILTKSIKGVVKINELLVPLLIIFIIYLGTKNLTYIKETSIQEITSNLNSGNILKNIIIGLISSILYASYNSIILIPVLASLGRYIKEEKTIKRVSILTGATITILALIIYGLLLRGINYANELEMPLIQIIKEFGSTCKIIYEFVIIASIFTSAISAGYSFLENTTQNNNKKMKSRNIKLLLICIIGILISNIGFSNLVQILYPTFGILGLIQCILLNSKTADSTIKL